MYGLTAKSPQPTPPGLEPGLCLPFMCPWCILRAEHGNVPHARARATELNILKDTGALPPQAAFITAHALRWIQDLPASSCDQVTADSQTVDKQDDDAAPILSGAYSVWTGRSMSAAAPAMVQHAPDARHPSWLVRLPPPPPPPPPPAVVDEWSQWAVLPQALSNSSSEPLHTLLLEYWHGKGLKWQPYEEDVQCNLRRMALAGCMETMIECDGKRYGINLSTMKQTRLDTGMERQMRVRTADDV
jgi:hypothetical protein